MMANCFYRVPGREGENIGIVPNAEVEKTPAGPSECIALKLKAYKDQKECVYRFGDYRQALRKVHALTGSKDRHEYQINKCARKRDGRR